jgi:hypothetical protein
MLAKASSPSTWWSKCTECTGGLMSVVQVTTSANNTPTEQRRTAYTHLLTTPGCDAVQSMPCRQNTPSFYTHEYICCTDRNAKTPAQMARQETSETSTTPATDLSPLVNTFKPHPCAPNSSTQGPRYDHD